MGSEMCIRDRCADLLRRQNHRELVRSPRRHEPERDLTEAQLVDCLLYTSDAADERSSVDLGGRRIIKKKKYTTLTGVRM